MHLITLRALRRLISGVDIAPGMIRQEYFFHFITSLAIYVHLITISHLRQFPPVADMSLYLFISDFFHLITPKHSSENSLQVCVAHVHLLFCGFWGGGFPHTTAKMLLYTTHRRPAPSNHGLPGSSAGKGRTRSPGFGQGSASNSR